MSIQIPGVIVPLLLIAWVAQMRLCANMTGQDYRRERNVTRFGGLACLAAAVVIGVMKFF